jgi:hypothetical protein
MAKAKRGKNVKKIPGWRGQCPVCKRIRVKLLWTGTKDAVSINVCKKCGK